MFIAIADGVIISSNKKKTSYVYVPSYCNNLFRMCCKEMEERRYMF